MKKNIYYLMKMNDGNFIPQFGLGVYLAKRGRECRKAVRWALNAGYRHIDTASSYGNEKDVGDAIRDSGIKREEIFITTKLWNDDQGFESALRAFDNSLKKLNTKYVDLYLIHWPVKAKRKESWKALEKIYESGYCHSIGISNYTINHLKELFTYANRIPTLNQVEFSPYLYQKELLDFCTNHNILLSAYAPLTRVKKFTDPTLLSLSKDLNKTVAQILIRWAIEHNLVVIPKSVQKEHILENADVYDFSLSNSHMNLLDNMDENLRTCWNPTTQD
jgi:diketogulonate reductase-like aldo/keto reductase